MLPVIACGEMPHGVIGVDHIAFDGITRTEAI
jgi:hypothetical protein